MISWVRIVIRIMHAYSLFIPLLILFLYSTGGLLNFECMMLT